MAAGSSLVVPMVLWGRHAPTHCISAILMTPDGRYVVTGCNDGQICIWDVLDHMQVAPRNMLFGHTAAISCIAVGSEQKDKCYIVTSSENGEMCLWDVSDGRCIENTKMDKVHSEITSYHLRSSKALRLICNGYYDEIVIIDPLSLEILTRLVARSDSDWMSACCVINPPNRDDDVILAITNSGTVKVWTLSSALPEHKGNKITEDESKQIRCLNAQTLTCCPGNLRTVLIVCSKYWQVYNFTSRNPDNQDAIYDASDFTLLCSESNRRGERWTGGDFLSVDRVIVWSNEGRGYLYKLPTNLLKGKAVARIQQKNKSELPHANPDHKDYHRPYNQTSVHAYYVLDIFTQSKNLDCSPAFTYVNYGSGETAVHLLLRGDSEGRVTIWSLPQVSEKQMTLVRQESFDRLPALSPKSSTTLQESWTVGTSSPPGILDNLMDGVDDDPEVFITATIYIPSQGKLVCGRNNGTIVLVPAIDCIKRQLLTLNKSSQVTPRVLVGHHGRVTCLLYPFNEATRYEPNHLLSGGTDFSVILWDVNTGVKIHTFTVHGGSLTQMTVPPANCNPRILSCICSVAGDHSVALLSLKERKCVLLASRHLYPVKMIKWRPLDDFMLVQTKDGIVTVWQMETGHLDRVIDGKTAEDVLNNCDENAMPVEALTNPSITLAQALKRRNLATFKNFTQQKLNITAQPNQNSQGNKVEFMKPTGFPLLIQGVKTNTRDPDAHVLFFDTEALIVHLLTEEYALLSPAELEARGMTLPQGDKIQPHDFMDGQQKLTEDVSNSSYEMTLADFKEEDEEHIDPTREEDRDVDSVFFSASYSSTAGRNVPPRLNSRPSSFHSSLSSSTSPSPSSPTSPSGQAPQVNPAVPLRKKSKFPLRFSSKSKSVSSSSDLDSEKIYRGSKSLKVKSHSPTEGKKTNSLPRPASVPVDLIQSETEAESLLARAKEKAETVGQKIQNKLDAVGNVGGQPIIPIQTQPTSARKRPDSITVHESLSMAIGELFMSCLHAWNLDLQLDDLCLKKLGLHKPKCPISFGLLSHGGHMSLMLPGWHRHQAQDKLTPGGPMPTQVVQKPSEVEGETVSRSSRPSTPRRDASVVACQQQAYDFSTKMRWQISSAVTTQHLLSVISVANTLMGMSRAVFMPELLHPTRPKGDSLSSNFGLSFRETDSPESFGSSDSDSADMQATLQAQVKQGWSLLAAMHCVLLPELVGLDYYQCPQLEMLARRWQDRCLEIREAAQALLLAELRRINPEGRKRLLDMWAPYLPSYIDAEHSILSSQKDQRDGEEIDMEDEESILGGDIPSHKLSVSFESRRKQATAIVMLGVIGAEFGHEIEPSRAKPEDIKKSKKQGPVEGFSLTNYSLARNTSKALTFILLHPPTPKLPPNTPIRRAAIDLIGRGFTVWEPYIDVSAVLLGLLELSIDSNRLIPRLLLSLPIIPILPTRILGVHTTYGLPLSPMADTCRSARHALSLIATARPPAFVITMAKEVARYNALAQNAQHQNAHAQNHTLARASAEILHIIELLVEKIPNDVADLIVEAMDVTMFCLDLNTLKAKGLPELFPAICRFSMVAYCQSTKRVWVGARNGCLALYEMKQHSRCQLITAHQGAITAVAVNSDGKYLATFSHVDNKLKFWQTPSSTLFGIGSQQTKHLRTYATPPIAASSVSNILKLVRLVWVDKTSIFLLTVDGQELKYTV
ncbi:WD repeat-containing protein 7-like isoform X1 [Biomphalaria glabrata]|uniref:WD repeat-containing protein 7-like isoform X1 n=2 Tax=Biomphalaria glabrata TaxID=6526 RepID=A0A9W3AU40_BIOGL|nr:WD repeat-containing protein 7-like isoform X1 [Biomphalaria glabrata]XP_055890753.1 WD repeat-containing protein 7-like isoform X1 [Biomphalaria glabrata]XP_055890754.1 WD repeat-containing protein 7-like isoform X1 [Biomphalaria glabrata]XP_055890755.1 WD repeat-containing protein 7-like isoform X1 [Biomphalaria glabrata]XP_055890756.1 WD repeat-containing protein 7-like isoform X1 [Biomphalaria glabrata]XP_055890757.1 WD repeat-containing protein 7-like isoform X1 [Biomphalaria glabrata]